MTSKEEKHILRDQEFLPDDWIATAKAIGEFDESNHVVGLETEKEMGCRVGGSCGWSYQQRPQQKPKKDLCEYHEGQHEGDWCER